MTNHPIYLVYRINYFIHYCTTNCYLLLIKQVQKVYKNYMFDFVHYVYENIKRSKNLSALQENH